MKIDQQIKRAAKILIGRKKEGAAGRHLTVYDDDIFLTSYPRSGNIWVRFLVAYLVWYDENMSILDMGARVPDIYKRTNSYMASLSRPRYLKSHEYFDPRYSKVLYIVRDVRSVMVSYYNFEVKMGRITAQFPYREFARKFLRGELDRFGSWRENVLSWLRLRGRETDRFLLIRYEDLHTHGLETLRKMANFLGLQRSSEQLEFVLKLSAFNRLRALEKEAQQVSSPLPGETFDILTIRSGRTDEWREVLDNEVLDMIWRDCGEILVELGYHKLPLKSIKDSS